jgi:peptidyl-prolyl cis-trans isomerase D
LAKRGNRIFVWIVVGLLLVGLAGFGTTTMRGTTDTLGTIGDKEIPLQAYATALQNQIRAIEQQTGRPFTLAQAQEIGLDRAVLARLVSERGLDHETARLGLSVGDRRVAEAVLASPAFQGLDGRFDRELYREQLRRLGLTEAEFEADLRDSTARTLLSAAVAGAVPAPAAYADTLAAWLGERRAVTWATVTAADLAEPLPEPSEAELRAHHAANPDAFTAPETRAIAYAWLTPAMLAPAIEVPEDEVRALYEARIDEYVQEERRLVERLVFPSEAEAAAARARLDAGEAGFDDLVAGRGLRLADVDLGDVSRDDLEGAAEAVFAAAPGEVVGPLPTLLGPALFRVNAVLAASEIPFAAAAADLRREIATDRAAARIRDLAPEAEDLLAGGAGLADLAARLGMETGRLVWSEDVSDGIAAYAAFRAAARAAAPGAFPELRDTEDGGIFALVVESITPPAIIPFEEARATVLAHWRAAQEREAVLALAQARAEAVAGGASFESQGLVPRAEPPLTRRDFVEGTTPDFMPAAFRLAPGGATAIPAPDGAIVLRLDAVAPPTPDDPGTLAERRAHPAQKQAALARDLLDAFADTILAGTETRIDEAALAAVHAQFR